MLQNFTLYAHFPPIIKCNFFTKKKKKMAGFKLILFLNAIKKTKT